MTAALILMVAAILSVLAAAQGMEMPDTQLPDLWNRVHPGFSYLAPLATVAGTAGLAYRLLHRGRRAELRRRVIDALADAVLIVDSRNRVLETNRAARVLLGVPDGEPAVAQLELRFACPQLGRLLTDLDGEDGEFSSGGPASVRRDYEVRVYALRPGPPGVRAVVVRDVTARRHSEDQPGEVRRVDGLTGLNDRRRFGELLEASIAAARQEGRLVALLLLDVLHLREINERLGHAVGDGVLRAVMARLKHRVRVEDSVHHVEARGSWADMFRFGGDAFAILLSRISSPEDASAVAARVLAAVAEPIAVEEHRLTTTASVGVAVAPQDSETAEGLARCAEAALRQASERGGGVYQFFRPELDAAMERRMAVELRLRHALENGVLTLHYQPKVELASERVVGGEALLRWHDEELGAVSPGEFIPLAERVGLITQIGAFVVEAACRQLSAWQCDGHELVPVSVNVSSVQLAQTDVARLITETLERHRVEPRWLQIEITESAPLGDVAETTATLHRLRRMGVRVALDDFGTGYSALSYLPAFPLDAIKLDRSLVADLVRDAPTARVAEGVIAIAHGLGLEVVAEGVEKPEQARILREMGCDQIQGFLVSPALPPDEFASFICSRDTGTWTRSSA